MTIERISLTEEYDNRDVIAQIAILRDNVDTLWNMNSQIHFFERYGTTNWSDMFEHENNVFTAKTNIIIDIDTFWSSVAGMMTVQGWIFIPKGAMIRNRIRFPLKFTWAPTTPSNVLRRDCWVEITPADLTNASISLVWKDTQITVSGGSIILSDSTAGSYALAKNKFKVYTGENSA